MACGLPIFSDNVFTSFAGRGERATAQALSETAIWKIVTYYAQACALGHVKPHDFRRFVGTQLAAKDIRKAQLALGHKSIEVTARHYILDTLEVGETDNLFEFIGAQKNVALFYKIRGFFQ